MSQNITVLNKDKVTKKKSWQKRFFYIEVLYTLFLLSGIFVVDRLLNVLYFTVSLGTLSYQLVFCALISFTEMIKMKKSLQIIWLSAAINLAVAFIVYCILDYPIPNFWYESNGKIDTYYQGLLAI